MNTELLKEKMKDYFDNISPEEIISKFEAMGYSFVETRTVNQDKKSAIDKIKDFENQTLATITYNLIKWFAVDSIETTNSYRHTVESRVWIQMKISMKDKDWYIDGQQPDIVKQRLIKWINQNINKG